MTESEARDKILKKIESLKNERGIDVEFLGFYQNVWKGNKTRLILRREDGKIWNTTNFNSFTSGDQVKRDRSLEEYAKNNGYELLVIPYIDVKRVSEILDTYLKESKDITTKITKYEFRGLYPDININDFDPDNPPM